MSCKEASKASETPTSPKTTGKASVHRIKSEATSVTSGVPSPLDGTPVSAAVVEHELYALIGHGPYQIRVLGCAVLGLTSVLMEILTYRVIARPVDHWCRPPEDMAYLSADAWKNQSIPVEADGSYSQCTVYVTTWTDSAEDRPKERCSSWDYDIKDWGDSIVSRFGLVCDRKYLLTMVTILPSLSYAVFTPAAGFAADRFGRKPVATISSSVLLIVTIGCSVAVNFAFFLVNRAAVVTCGTFSYLTTFVLVYEGTGESKRWLFTLLHMAVAVTVAPPFLSTQEPSWALAHSIFFVPRAAFALWCSHLDESTAWLLATLRVKQAESAILVAARLNHAGEQTAREGLRALCTDLRKVQRNYEPQASASSPSSPSNAPVEATRTRRRAMAAFFSRFACGGVFFGLTLTDKLSGPYWQVLYIIFSIVCYSIITWVTNNYGPRDTLSWLLTATCVSAVARATSTYVGFDFLSGCIRTAMKVVSSGSLGVIMCYLADVFPAKNRCTGVGMSIVVGGTGSILGISLANVDTVRPGFLFDVFYAFMMLVSVFAVQWLPEVLIEKSSCPMGTMSPDERKQALKASLKRKEKSRSRHRTESKIDVERQPAS